MMNQEQRIKSLKARWRKLAKYDGARLYWYPQSWRHWESQDGRRAICVVKFSVGADWYFSLDALEEDISDGEYWQGKAYLLSQNSE
jgi:hypothetical protein